MLFKTDNNWRVGVGGNTRLRMKQQSEGRYLAVSAERPQECTSIAFARIHLQNSFTSLCRHQQKVGIVPTIHQIQTAILISYLLNNFIYHILYIIYDIFSVTFQMMIFLFKKKALGLLKSSKPPNRELIRP